MSTIKKKGKEKGQGLINILALSLLK